LFIGGGDPVGTTVPETFWEGPTGDWLGGTGGLVSSKGGTDTIGNSERTKGRVVVVGQVVVGTVDCPLVGLVDEMVDCPLVGLVDEMVVVGGTVVCMLDGQVVVETVVCPLVGLVDGQVVGFAENEGSHEGTTVCGNGVLLVPPGGISASGNGVRRKVG